MKRLLPLLLLASAAHASTVTFTWLPVTQFTDGTSITQPVTYSILQGPSGKIAMALDSNIAASGVSEPLNLANGNCFAIYAVVAGVQSPPSAPYCISETPAAPTNLLGTVSP